MQYNLVTSGIFHGQKLLYAFGWGRGLHPLILSLDPLLLDCCFGLQFIAWTPHCGWIARLNYTLKLIGAI